MSFKIVSWNVNSIRKGVHDTLVELSENQSPDIICFQETKATGPDAEKYFANSDLKNIYPYRYWNDSVSGQAGVAVWSKVKPLNVFTEVPRLFHLKEGRILILEFDTFILLNTYVPNTGRGEIAENERKVWHNAIISWLSSQLDTCGTDTDTDKFLIWCGDLNVVREPALDTTHHKVVPKKPSAGMKQFERDHLAEYLDLGLNDVFRSMYPDKKSYTWFSPRIYGVGWRLDYFLVNDMSKIEDIFHNEKLDSKISDHTWIMLTLC